VYYWERLRNFVFWKGDVSEAKHFVEEARRLGRDEGTPQLLAYMDYNVAMYDGRFQDALKALSLDLSGEAVDNQFIYTPVALLRAHAEKCLGNEASAKKDFEAARAELALKLKTSPDDERLHSSLGLAYAGLGRKEDAVRAGMRGVELLPVEKEAWRGANRLIDLARIYAMIGDQEKAMDVLERLLSIPAEISRASLKLDSWWIPLRGNARFQKLINTSPSTIS
jgi:tetratricopeptide (TPR) repeat protein